MSSIHGGDGQRTALATIQQQNRTPQWIIVSIIDSYDITTLLILLVTCCLLMLVGVSDNPWCVHKQRYPAWLGVSTWQGDMLPLAGAPPCLGWQVPVSLFTSDLAPDPHFSRGRPQRCGATRGVARG